MINNKKVNNNHSNLSKHSKINSNNIKINQRRKKIKNNQSNHKKYNNKNKN